MRLALASAVAAAGCVGLAIALAPKQEIGLPTCETVKCIER